jgi:hypothetical protein
MHVGQPIDAGWPQPGVSQSSAITTFATILQTKNLAAAKKPERELEGLLADVAQRSQSLTRSGSKLALQPRPNGRRV